MVKYNGIIQARQTALHERPINYQSRSRLGVGWNDLLGFFYPMNKKKQLEIKTVSVEIKVVRVDGHKMTKATFHQIERFDSFAADTKVAEILGWVNHGDPNATGIWVLSVLNGNLIKGYCRHGIERIQNNHDQLFIAT